MSIYKVFAANLRAQCARFESIEAVCRGARVNRQQFNKYLAGQVLPQARTLSRICAFLGVDEISLFSVAGNPPAEADHRHRITANAFAPASAASTSPLPLGYYLCFFPLQHFDTHLVVSTLCLRAEGRHLLFSRRTLFRSPSDLKTVVVRGRHRGVVMALDGGLYFQGFNAGTPTHPSLIYVDTQRLSGGAVYVGLALTRGTKTPIASQIALKYVGAAIRDGRNCLRATRVGNVSDPSLDPLVSLMFSRSREYGSAQLNIPLIEESLRSPP